MQVLCDRCNRTLEYSGDRPSFCAYCGQSLDATSARSTRAFALEDETPQDGPRSEPARAPDAIGGYRLLRPLGEGGMGTVYEAEDAASGRHVALKLIAREFSPSKEATERFRQEGRLASAIAHPRCVFVLAADEEAGRPYIVMELMPGSNLHDLVKRKGPLRTEEAIEKILDVIDGLREAHRLGVIHRDVKPTNCFLEADGRVKVGDFGLAKSLVHDVHLTRTGTFLGTVLFASPEQIRRDTLDEQTDVYSVAATLYFLLTGSAPFEGGDAASTLARIVSEPAPPLRSLRPEVPPALERVVLRGLERQKERRWRNLDEFRAALLPFVTGHLSFGGLGVRQAAFLLDYFFLKLISSIVFLVAYRLGILRLTGRDPLEAFYLAHLAGDMAIWLAYFGLAEGLWGCAIGKFLLRLRVVGPGNDRAGLGRAFARILVYYGLTHMGTMVAAVLVWAVTPDDLAQRNQFAALVSSLPLLGMILGMVAAFLPMRARNGYRGLQDWLSGTSVVRIPWPERRQALVVPAIELPPLAQPHELPEKIGPYHIRGALAWSDTDRLIVADDPNLDRRVWIWLRPEAELPTADARRETSRTTRTRWLSCGTMETMHWDAFVAPVGCPLAAALANGPFDWPEARYCLEQLTDELATACGDGTLPTRLGIRQLWLQPNGGLQLLDFPIEFDGKDSAATDGTDADACALALLARTAVRLLEPPDGEARRLPTRIRAPLPGHATRLLGRLLGGADRYRTTAEFRAALHDTRQEATEVNRPRRAAQMAVATLFLVIGLMSTFMAGWLADFVPLLTLSVIADRGQATLPKLDDAIVADQTLAGFAPTPATRLAGIAVAVDDLELRTRLTQEAERADAELHARLDASGWATRQYFQMAERAVTIQEGAQTTRAGKPASNRANGILDIAAQRRTIDDVFADVMLGLILAWPALWIVNAFVFRGGISYRLSGMTLVRRDGRPAWRLQCAWRALLVWAPVTALLAGSLLASRAYWSHWEPGVEPSGVLWLASILWWGAFVSLIGYLVLALAQPSRALHDRLAGTYLVPR